VGDLRVTADERHFHLVAGVLERAEQRGHRLVGGAALGQEERGEEPARPRAADGDVVGVHHERIARDVVGGKGHGIGGGHEIAVAEIDDGRVFTDAGTDDDAGISDGIPVEDRLQRVGTELPDWQDPHAVGSIRSPRMIIECVANVSEGRDARALAAVAEAIRAVVGAHLADVHSDGDHHRSVFTVLGTPAAIEAATLALADAALPRIDMREHHGLHPRLGALDVVPFVPMGDAPMAVAVDVARRVGAAIAERHALPVYFYGTAARSPARRELPDVRRGGYEGLAARLATPAGVPDAGPARFDARAGAVVVGAREVLVAYNVWLDTADLEVARAVARAVRERDGGLRAVRALGVALPSRGLVQVSLNLLDYRVTPLPAVFDRVERESARHGVRIRRGELVGLAPRAAFGGRAPASVGLRDFTEAADLEAQVAKVAG
jgi:glutamate formiminotransferase